MSSNNLFVNLKFEDRQTMENVESPTKPSPLNLTTRSSHERNVLKELNSTFEGVST